MRHVQEMLVSILAMKFGVIAFSLFAPTVFNIVKDKVRALAV